MRTIINFHELYYPEKMSGRVTDDHEELYRFVLSHINGTYILDAGCGAGRFSHDLAVAGKKVVAVDSDTYTIDYAIRRKEHPDVVYKVANIESRLGFFDAITCLNTIVHCTNVPLVLDNFYASLFKGGEIWISSIDPYVLRRDKYRNPHEPSQMRKQTLVALLKNAGFTIKGEYGQRPITMWRTYPNLVNKIINHLIGRPEETASPKVKPWRKNHRYYLIHAVK